MIVKHQSYKYLLLTLIGILVAIGLSACATPAPAPAPVPRLTLTPVPMPTPVPTNSESAPRIAELEAKIRQLEAENQQLREENLQLRNDLTKMSSVLQNLHSLVASSTYTNTLSRLMQIQNNTSDLAAFVDGLPDLPPLPPGLTVSRINDAVEKARSLRDILKILPPPPPLAPIWWTDLDNMRQTFIDMTEWMENLEDLPGFLSSAQSLEELRSRIQGYVVNVESTAADAKSTMEKVRDAVSP